MPIKYCMMGSGNANPSVARSLGGRQGKSSLLTRVKERSDNGSLNDAYEKQKKEDDPLLLL